jgi:hypothetical protein
LIAHIRAFAAINRLAAFIAVLGLCSILWLVHTRKRRS